MWPQIVYLILFLIGLGIAIERHGKEKTGKENFLTTFISGIAILYLLYMGHFFDVFFK
jgi:hypothetical protein